MDIFIAVAPALAVACTPQFAHVVASRTGVLCPVIPLALFSAVLVAWAPPSTALIAALAVPLALADVLARSLPDSFTLPAYPAVLAGLTATGPPGALWRAVAASGGVLAVLGLGHLAAPTALGFGDVKLAGLLALPLGWTSWTAVWTAAVLALTVGGLAAGWALTRGRREIPYGPVLLAGALMTLL